MGVVHLLRIRSEILTTRATYGHSIIRVEATQGKSSHGLVELPGCFPPILSVEEWKQSRRDSISGGRIPREGTF